MSAALICNHILSFAVVMICWWMAHLSALPVHGPIGRLTSLAYGALATITVAVAIFRHLEFNNEWMPIIYKLAIIVLCIGNAVLIHDRLRRKANVKDDA